MRTPSTRPRPHNTFTKGVSAVAALAASSVILLGCGGGSERTEPAVTSAAVPPTSPVEPVRFADGAELLDAMDDLTGMLHCDFGESVTVAVLPGGNSFYSNLTEEDGNGLFILTVDGVSYARFTGELDADASKARRAIVAKLGKGADAAWGTWGQPDTIALEELPTSSSGCLAWNDLQAGDFVGFTAAADGSTTFTVNSVKTGGETWMGTVRREGEGLHLRIVIGEGSEFNVRAGTLPGQDQHFTPTGGTSAPEGYKEISQDEYFALVGN